jgi:site-specific DNA-methyltransferase (adenine-specific)
MVVALGGEELMMAKKIKTESQLVIPTLTAGDSAFALACGDSVTLMQNWPGELPNLQIHDCPYNQGMVYGAGYNDNRPVKEFQQWLYTWLEAAAAIMPKDGAMWFFAPDEWVSSMEMYCRNNLGLTRRNWCTWIYTFGQSAQKSFTRSHTHMLYFTGHKTRFTFNTDAVRVPSARELVYNDKRAVKGGKAPDDTFCLLRSDLEKALRADGDVWLQSRVAGTFKERVNLSPNQIPVPLLRRIIAACSNPGDLVLDGFVGSGSTVAAALQLGRRAVGIDLSPECITHSRQRAEQVLAGTFGGSDVPGQLPLFGSSKKKPKKN